MTELLDIYDDNLNKIGTKPRDAVHRDGDWHRVFHCWVIYRNSDGQDWVVFQKRAANKAMWPNFLDVSAAGHYEADETVDDGVREIEEELGLDVDFSDLIPVGRRVAMYRYDNLIERNVANVFLHVCDRPLAQYQYRKEEVAGLVAVNVERGLALFAGSLQTIAAPAVGYESPMITISASDFIPTYDDYFYKVLILAKRCLDGEAHLRI